MFAVEPQAVVLTFTVALFVALHWFMRQFGKYNV